LTPSLLILLLIYIHTLHFFTWIEQTPDIYSESGNGYGNSAKQHWASLNKHFLLSTSLFIDFYCKYMFIRRQVKYSRLKINDNFGSGENLLGRWKHLLGKCISNLLLRGQLNWKKYCSRPGLESVSFFT